MIQCMDAARNTLRRIMLGLRSPQTALAEAEAPSARHAWELNHDDLWAVLRAGAAPEPEQPPDLEDDEYDRWEEEVYAPWEEAEEKFERLVIELFPEFAAEVSKTEEIAYADTALAVWQARNNDLQAFVVWAEANPGVLAAAHARLIDASYEAGYGGRVGKPEFPSEAAKELPFDYIPERAFRQLVDEKSLYAVADQWEEVGDPFQVAKNRFGVTNNPDMAFYLLPDGEMLHGGGEAAGGRAWDHRNIGYGGGGTRGMQEFMGLGAIRLMPESGSLDMVVEPTNDQYRTLRKWIDHFNGEVSVELEHGLGEFDDRNEWYRENPNRAYKEFDRWTDNREVLRFIQKFFARGGSVNEAKKNPPKWDVLKKTKKPLTDEERDEVMRREATWHHGPKGAPSPAVWKSVVGDNTWYITNTHRAYNVRPTLRGAISRYHKFIKSTA
jgi:hypothetical protein